MADGTVKRPKFRGRLLMVGFGSIGQRVLPLLLRHIDIAPGQITIVNAHGDGGGTAQGFGVALQVCTITQDNLADVLAPLLSDGDFLINLSVDVSSTALMAWCRERGALYLDTCTEPWARRPADAQSAPDRCTNYARREAVLALRTPGRESPTAVSTHGANPGLVSHFVKQALLDVARATGTRPVAPVDREGWACLARDLGVRVIHIAERDTQASARHRGLGEFVNTWSVRGLVSEALQPAELGWGTHERHLPPDARRHADGCGAAIFLMRPGLATRVRSWTPLAGPQHGLLISHAEAISLADYLTLGCRQAPDYRPTVHYAYHPCDDAMLSLDDLAARSGRLQGCQRILGPEIDEGEDELGVLLMGHARNAYWYGSRLSIDQARECVPFNNATTLQVAASVMAGVVWAMTHPRRGVVEPEELPFDEVIAHCRPYLGQLYGKFTDWTPLRDRGALFDEVLDRTDP